MKKAGALASAGLSHLRGENSLKSERDTPGKALWACLAPFLEGFRAGVVPVAPERDDGTRKGPWAKDDGDVVPEGPPHLSPLKARGGRGGVPK